MHKKGKGHRAGGTASSDNCKMPSESSRGKCDRYLEPNFEGVTDIA